MIDSHCHLDLAAFDNDWLQQIEAAKAKDVTRFLVPGTTEAGWDKQLAMTQTVAEIDIAFGLHPYFLPDDAEPVLARLDARLKQSTASLVALGEIGIDASLTTPIQRQQQVFEKQLSMANQYQLPVILHHRKSHHLLIESLKRCRFQFGGVIHAFSGSLEAAKAYTDLGFCIGVGGTITY
ncbi:MAG: TatD family hydrolase, partial [Aestuariibacter sp.]|nr:TatD family hydrolase [Aestuariibacter sp.]MCP4237427.1 TatD family hydrolase [Aestuariibacter sp.]